MYYQDNAVNILVYHCCEFKLILERITEYKVIYIKS